MNHQHKKKNTTQPAVQKSDLNTHNQTPQEENDNTNEYKQLKPLYE